MEFVTFEIANKLKEKGFREKCLATFNNCGEFEYNEIESFEIESIVSVDSLLYSQNSLGSNFWVDAPTISQVLKWLRESKRIDAGSVWDNRDGKWVGYINEMDMPDLVGEYILPNTYDTYEQAVIVGIEYVLDNLI